MKEGKSIPTVWFSLKKSLHCKSEPSDVHDPKTRSKQQHLTTISTRKTSSGGGGGGRCSSGTRSGCSRSIANLKDVVIHGSKRHMAEKPPSCSPRSIGSSEFLNPITHEVILSNSRCELKITSFMSGFPDGAGVGVGVGAAGGGSTYVGTLRPGTPGPGGHPTMHYFNPSYRHPSTPPRKTNAAADREINFPNSNSNSFKPTKASLETDAAINGTSSSSSSSVVCHKCGEQFGKWEALESHHLSKHAG